MLFTLTHFCPLCIIATTHLTCVFPSLTNGMHIVNHASDVILIFLRLQKKFTTLKLLLQTMKCATWSPQRLNQFLTLPLDFFTHESNIHILGAPMGPLSIYGVHIKDTLGKLQHNNQPSYAYKSSNSFQNAFTLLCLMAKLPIVYYISITRYLVALH